MKTSAIILSGLILFSISLAPYAGAEQGMPGPPLSQSLVREGTLAMNLANAFKLGSPTTEAEAESALTNAGIMPRNGWIADYPVTPNVVIELRNAVGSAADARRLALNKVEALQIFENVAKDYELPIQAVNTGPIVSPGTTLSMAPPEQNVINTYYTEQGPPVVTYYAPPADYTYLYNYVPSPFWWSNAWFAGYYMLRDFSLLALGYGNWYHGYWPGYGYGYWGGYGRYGYWGGYGYTYWHGGHDNHDGHHGDGHGDGGHGDGHGGHGGDRHVVSNHYRDRDTGATHRIDPVTRAHNGNRAAGERWADNATQRSAKAIYDRSHNTNVTGNSGNNRPSPNNRPAYTNSYNRGVNANTGRAYTASTRSYSSSGYYRQPVQRSSYQTRQGMNSQGRGTAYNNASYSANRGQFNGGRSFNGNGRGGNPSGSSGRGAGGGQGSYRTSAGGRRS